MWKRGVPFDYFSLPVRGFNIKGQESSKSWLGFICTLGLFGAVMALFLSELVSMFRREGLTVSIAEEGVADPPPTNLKGTLMAFSVTNRVSPLVSLTYNVDFHIKAEMVTWKKNGRLMSFSSQSLVVQPCETSEVGDIDTEGDQSANFDSLYCLSKLQSDELFTIQGQLGVSTFKELVVKVYCGAVGATVCPPSFTSANVVFMYGASYLDASNYEKPVSLTSTAFIDRADTSSYHEKIIQVTPREIVTDHGLVFSDLQTKSDIVVSQGQTIMDGINSLIPEVFSFRIQMSYNKIIVTRTYKTIFDVLASATGIASTITLIVVLVIAPYIEHKTHEDIMKTIYPETRVEVKFQEYLKAMVGVKASKAKLKKIGEEKEWITENLDMIKMIKNWSDFDKMKMKMTVGSPAEMHEVQESSFVSAVSMEKQASFVHSNTFRAKIRPESLAPTPEQEKINVD